MKSSISKKSLRGKPKRTEIDPMQNTYRFMESPEAFVDTEPLPDVPPEQIQQWREGNKKVRKPKLVEGDNIRQRVETQILTELEVKGLKPYLFDYKESPVLMLQNLKQVGVP